MVSILKVECEVNLIVYILHIKLTFIIDALFLTFFLMLAVATWQS